MGASSRPEPSRRLARLSASPFADTLAAILGRRVPTEATGLDVTTGADYNPEQDRIRVNRMHLIASPDRDNLAMRLQSGNSRNDLDWILTHENGHAFANTAENAPLKLNYLHFTEGANANDPYARMHDGGERFAQAYANAVDFLRTTSAKPLTESDYQRALTTREQDVPGTGFLVQHLLERPIYDKHPARGVIPRPDPLLTVEDINRSLAGASHYDTPPASGRQYLAEALKR